MVNYVILEIVSTPSSKLVITCLNMFFDIYYRQTIQQRGYKVYEQVNYIAFMKYTINAAYKETGDTI